MIFKVVSNTFEDIIDIYMLKGIQCNFWVKTEDMVILGYFWTYYLDIFGRKNLNPTNFVLNIVENKVLIYIKMV